MRITCSTTEPWTTRCARTRRSPPTGRRRASPPTSGSRSTAAPAADVAIAALMDRRDGAAARAAAAVANWSPGPVAYQDLDSMLAAGGLDAVVNLTPAPLHGSVNQAVLDAGLHLYSEKPLAS